MEKIQKKLCLEKYFNQFLIISVFVTIFYDLATFRLWKDHFSLFVFCTLLLFNMVSIFLIIKCWKKMFFINTLKSLYKNWWVLLLIILPRLFQFNTMIRWDSTIYYKSLLIACQNYQLDLKNFFDSFALVGHSTYFYAAITGIGEFLFPQNIIGVHFINLTLTVLLAFILKKIIIIVFPQKKDDLELNLLVLCIISSPLFLGTFTIYNADFGVVFCFFFMIYMQYHKKYILMAAFAIGVFLSKETGSFWIAGYTISEVLFYRLELFSYFSKKRKQFAAICLSLALLGVLFLFTGGANYILAIAQGKTSFTFQLDNHYIIQILKEIFILNFSWIYTSIMVVTIIYIGIKRRMFKQCSRVHHTIRSIIAASLIYTIFLCVFKAGVISRYIIGLSLTLILVSLYFLDKAIKKNVIKKSILILLILLSFAESYVTIDPLTLKSFGNISTGKLPMVNVSCAFGEFAYTGDLTVYNYQYSYMDKSIDKILKKVKFNNAVCEIFIRKGREVEMFIDGGKIYILNYNMLKGQREREKIISSENKNISNIVINNIEDMPTLSEQGLLSEEVLIIVFDEEYTEEREKMIEQYYTIQKKGTEGVFLQGQLYYAYGKLIQ